MTCEYYNSKLPICRGTPCENEYDCQRIKALKEMREEVPQRPSIENVFDSIILFESETIDLNEVKRMAN